MEQKREGVCFAQGFQAGSACAFIKENAIKDDVAVIVSNVPCNAAAVYTKNIVKAAPLLVTKEHLANKKAQAVVINSSNANAVCSKAHLNALEMAYKTGEVFKINPEDVLVASTGVIGQELPIHKITKALETIHVDEYGSRKANIAIMTTDTREKSFEIEFKLDGKVCHMGGICKGSGMIHPNMGTMLCFITTDAAISSEMLEKSLQKNVKKTFNRVSVDGDTSTNDMVIILANGLAGNPEIQQENDAFRIFDKALHTLMQILAIEIARDGEGASRLITVTVAGAASEEQAEVLAKSVISSSLLKAAMFGKDANWGRVMCALGYAGEEFDPAKTDISFSSVKGMVPVCIQGMETDFDEDKALEILSENMVDIFIDLHQGKESATCWGCDLTYDYVKINGDYRT